MKQGIIQQSVLPLIAACLILTLSFIGCEKDKSGRDAQTITGSENIAVKASAGGSSGSYCYYTPKGSPLGDNGSRNCHGFAWQNTRVPYSVPDHGISAPDPFWRDGSYYKVRKEDGIKLGDRVVFPATVHSAVVEYINGQEIDLISYWNGDDDQNGNPIIRIIPYTEGDFYRVSDEKYWNTPNCPRRKIGLYAPMMNRYVCADFYDNTNGATVNPNAPLWANRTWIREWETFYLMDAGGGKVYLWSYATFAYVNASPTSRAIANGGYSGPGAKFTLETLSPNSYFKSDLNINNRNYYLRSDSFIPQNMYIGGGACFQIIDLQ